MIDTHKLWRVSPNGRPKDTIILHYSTIDAVKTALQNDTKAVGSWFDAVVQYEMYGTIPTFEDADSAIVPILQAMFSITRSQLDINHEKWLEVCDKNARNRGGKTDNKP